MSQEDTEIEIKIPVSEKRFEKVKEKLKKIAEFEKSLNHKDEYFTPAHRNFVGPEYPFEWLSLRRRGGKAILNYKHWRPENVEKATHCDEFETELKSPEQLLKTFSSLDLEKLVTIKKEREVYNYKGKFEVALDKVEELGIFVEVESTAHKDSVEETREEIIDFAQNLGIDTSNIDKRGYPYLLMDKKGLID